MTFLICAPKEATENDQACVCWFPVLYKCVKLFTV